MTSRLSRLQKHIEVLCSQPRTPQSKGYFATQEYLRSQIRAAGLKPLTHKFSISGLGECSNIYTEFSTPNATPRILIGAHYESYHCSGPGADDNASAVAVLLELLKQLPKGMPICLMFFDMEEPYRMRALRGSAAFAKFYPHPLSSVVILDLVGGNFAPGFESMYYQFGNSMSALSHSELEFIHLPQMVVEPLGSWGARSDYHAFRKQGIPFTFLSSGTPWYYHTEFDRPDILNYEKMDQLVETLAERIPSELDKTQPLRPLRADPNQEFFRTNFQKFVRKLYEVEELRSPTIEKLAASKEPPRVKRLDILKIYSHVLPTLKKAGPQLWKAQGEQKATPSRA